MKITGVDRLPDDLGAQFNPKTNEISVRRGMEFADTFQCLATELAYAGLASGGQLPVNTALSAYSAAYILCKKYGVDTQRFNFSAAPKALGGLEAQAVKGELSQIRHAADCISARMAKQLDAVNKASKERDGR